jgi:hypothetical protein
LCGACSGIADIDALTLSVFRDSQGVRDSEIPRIQRLRFQRFREYRFRDSETRDSESQRYGRLSCDHFSLLDQYIMSNRVLVELVALGQHVKTGPGKSFMDIARLFTRLFGTSASLKTLGPEERDIFSDALQVREFLLTLNFILGSALNRRLRSAPWRLAGRQFCNPKPAGPKETLWLNSFLLYPNLRRRRSSCLYHRVAGLEPGANCFTVA